MTKPNQHMPITAAVYAREARNSPKRSKPRPCRTPVGELLPWDVLASLRKLKGETQ